MFNKGPSHDDDRVKIILSEYHELRQELMYLITEQRKSISIMFSVVAGQSVFLLNTKLNEEVMAYLYLFVVPLVIFILMVRSLESTSKILLIADYIHKGIKQQLKIFFNDKDHFFEWEEHKGNTNRISRRVLSLLDYSRWWIFSIGILSSFGLGMWHLYNTDYNIFIPIIASLINVIWIAISILVSKSFNEVDGESKQNSITVLEKTTCELSEDNTFIKCTTENLSIHSKS